MHIVLVQIHVKPEAVEAFKAACLLNAQGSLQEPGVLRFDVLQQPEEPTRFALLEVYRKPEDQGLHRQTAHYAAWIETVAPMMAEPRVGVKFRNVFPGDEAW